MGYINANLNPLGKIVGDCVIRSISAVTEKPWSDVFLDLSIEGIKQKDMPSSNAVWGSYLLSQGFQKRNIPSTCPHCYTVREFADDHPTGRYVIGTGTHAVAVIDGNYIDTWDSGDQIPAYYWEE